MVANIIEGNWLQLPFNFTALMGIVDSVIGMSFVSAVFQVLDWSFLVLHFEGNVCNWIPKVIWPRMDWFRGFLLENGFFVDFISAWTQICMNCFKCVCLLTTSNLSMISLRGILVCSLKKLLLFSHMIL